MKSRAGTIIFLTETGTHIGLGHINRCHSLAHAFAAAGYPSYFILHNANKENAIPISFPVYHFNWTKEKKNLLRYIKKDNIVIIDSYLASEPLYYDIEKKSHFCVYLDDTSRLNYPNGILVNSAINASTLYTKKITSITYLLGPDYQTLPPDFWSVKPISISDRINRILLTTGGNDQHNLSSHVLKKLTSTCPDLQKVVIIGKYFKNISAIEKNVDGNTVLLFYPDSAKMLDAMLSCDLAISSAGQTLYELARIGLPTLAIGTADNQIYNITGFQEKGFITFAGWWHEPNLFKTIDNKIKELVPDQHKRLAMAQAGSRLIDGKGCQRIVSEITAYASKN
jgi:UDP-2,4-diacetamido-2,4,6-trideoxy-beta-L-altropyranose hydrolase